jgi:hypothetical protein
MPDVLTPDLFPVVVPDPPTPEPMVNMVFDFPGEAEPPEGYELALHNTLLAVSGEVQGISNRRKARQFAVTFATEPSAEVQAAITQAVAVFDWAGLALATAKQAKADALGEWFISRSANGITIGTVTLAGSVEDQTRYASWVAVQNTALTLGVVTPQDNATIYDISGNAITLPLVQVLALLLQYAAKVQAISAKASAYRVAIASAATVEELDSIVFDEGWYP